MSSEIGILFDFYLQRFFFLLNVFWTGSEELLHLGDVHRVLLAGTLRRNTGKTFKKDFNTTLLKR